MISTGHVDQTDDQEVVDETAPGRLHRLEGDETIPFDKVVAELGIELS